MAKMFPNLAEDLNSQIQETARTLNWKNTKKSTPRCIISTLLETKDKGNRERQTLPFFQKKKQFERRRISHLKPQRPERRANMANGEEQELSTQRSSDTSKLSCRSPRASKASQVQEIWENLSPTDFLWRIRLQDTGNRKALIEGRTLEHQEGRKNKAKK